MAAARLSNIAAGVKVMKRGTVPVSSRELTVAMKKLRMNGGPTKN
jgi:bifunctional ADP-heptose synthase (sugar kinase/adenylyltransferase)